MMKLLKIFFLTLIILNLGAVVQAGKRFTSSYPCSDAVKTCVSSGTRIVDGFPVAKDCWEWKYIKTCNYPSKDDCKNFYHCYAVANHACLLKDSLGNCVNLHREFSCKSWDPVTIENQTVRTGLTEKDGQEGLVCKGIPCIDGNCVDKSYQTNGEMMDSVTKLYAFSKMNPDKLGNFNLFQGTGQHCSKKATSYTNCCQADPKGWGKSLGAGCTKDEKFLAERRAKNLCVYVGKQNKQTMGVTTVVKHHFCCWGSLLDKVIQVEGRKQLGINFGSGGSANCRGLTLEEIQRLDFSKMDFSEFIEDFKVRFVGKYKAPKAGDMEQIVKGGVDRLRKYDNNPHNQKNNMTGWSGDMQDESWEADEERRIEAERLELERLAKLEAELAKQEQLKIEAKNQRKIIKEQELKEANSKMINAWNYYVFSVDQLQRGGLRLEQFQPIAKQYQECEKKWKKLKSDLESGNY
jgi:hypothetical protein